MKVDISLGDGVLDVSLFVETVAGKRIDPAWLARQFATIYMTIADHVTDEEGATDGEDGSTGAARRDGE